MKRNAVLLLILLLLVLLPPPVWGYFSRFQAERQRESAPAQAARGYETAARLLFWERGLLEQAAHSAFAAGETERALALLLEARQRESLTPQGMVMLGEIYVLQGNWEAAWSQAWLPLWKSGNASPAVFARLAEYAARTQDAALETAALTHLLERNPADSSARYRLALLQAAEAPQTALETLAPLDDPQAERLRNDLRQALAEADPAYRALLIGRALASRNEWRLAMRFFRTALEANPGYAEAWAWQAEARYQTGEVAALVAQDYQTALALNPDSAGVQAMAGLYHERLGDFPQAERHYRRAVQLEPQTAAWHLALARVLARRDLPAALESYQAATRVAPEDASTWLALAAFCLEHEAYLEEIGLEAALRAYALAPENLDVLVVLGRILALTGETETARIWYERALALDPAYPAARFHLALLALQTGQTAQAREYFAQVTRIDPVGSYGRQAQEILTRYFAP